MSAPSATRLAVKVVPSSSRNAPAGWLGESFKIKVQAPPERGKANKAVAKLLARWLQIPESEVRLISGETNPAKVFEISGLPLDIVRQRLNAVSSA